MVSGCETNLAHAGQSAETGESRGAALAATSSSSSKPQAAAAASSKQQAAHGSSRSSTQQRASQTRTPQSHPHFSPLMR